MSLRYLTAGESHGKALIGILEGMPAGLKITEEEIHFELRRRKQGYGRGARQKIETDEVEILSGVRHGLTLGSPIGLIIRNLDWSAWKEVMQLEPASPPSTIRRRVDIPRPGHADLPGAIKYGQQDMRNVLERSSARETAMRVALAAVTKKFLKTLGIVTASRVVQIGSVTDPSAPPCKTEKLNSIADASQVRCTDPKVEVAMIKEIESARKSGDTLGGIFEVYASGVLIGLGSHVQWDRRLEAEITRAMMGLNAIKGVEIGLGFSAARIRGSLVHDEIFPSRSNFKTRYRTNRSGGINGGISTGQEIVVRAAMKPLSTLMKPLRSVDLRTGSSAKAHIERSDVCAVPAAAVVGESLLALTLAQAVIEKFGGDSIHEILPRIREWKNRPVFG